MTLLFTDGFQDGHINQKPDWSNPWTGFSGAGTGRDGSAGGAVTAYGTSRNTATFVNAPTTSTTVMGWAWIENQTLGSGNHYFLIGNASGVQLVMWLDTTGHWQARRGTTTSGTLLGTSSGHPAVLLNQWHYYELKVNLLSTATASLVFRMDNGVILNLSSVQTAATSGNVTTWAFNNDSGTGTTWIDDMYVCDTVDATSTQGQANNDFLGDIRIQSMYPNAAGDTTQWTPSTGANWAAVDEVPPNTTDYVSSGTSGQRDLYQLTDLAGTVSKIYCVQAGYYATKSDAGVSSYKSTIKENSVVTVDSTVFNPPTGSWVSNWGSRYFVKPSNSALWTTTDVNALQAGQDVV